MEKKIGKVGEVSWIIGNILCAVGNCIASKSGLGVATIVAPAFIVNRKFDAISVGLAEYIIQGLLLLLCCTLIGKFKSKFIFTICNILFYGACFDIVDMLFAGIVPQNLAGQIAVAAVGTLITGFAVAVMLRTYIPPSAYEIFVKEVAISKGLDMSKMKLIFDCSLLGISIVMMLVLLGEWTWDILGPLTLISAFLNSVLIGFFGKLLDRVLEFTPAIPKLYNWLDRDSKKE